MSFFRKVVLIAVLLGTVGIGTYTVFLADDKRETPPRKCVSNGFQEESREAGIDFRMNFLPDEQGEKFKINLYDHGCGLAVGDFDGDGHEDIYFLNQRGGNALYRNRGDGTFEDVTKKAGVALDDRVCVAAVFADTLNKGRQDLYVTSTRGGNVFFRNNGDGTFTDVTKEAGLTLVAHSQTATFFDYNNDGLLDLFVTNTAQWTLKDYDKEHHYYPGIGDLGAMAASPVEYNILYRNNGDGTFTDVTEKAGLKGKGWGGDVAVFDYNHDGHLDLFVTNMFGASQLYRNNGNGTFTDVTREVLGRTSWGAIGCKVFDFNNDGLLDLFIVDMHSDMWLPFNIPPNSVPPGGLEKKYPHVFGMRFDVDPGGPASENQFADMFKIRYDEVLFGNTFFKSGSSRRYLEVSDRANLETWWPWGIATGDFDNDGNEDVFLPSGMGYPFSYWPNALLMNNGNETFSDRAALYGIEPPPGGEDRDERIGGKPTAQGSRCAVTADFDGDGRVDLMVNNFNDRPYYFRNRFPQKNYIAFKLTGGGGAMGNQDAIGALVTIHMGKDVMVRQVHAAGGYLSQSSRTIHFGLGDRTKVDKVEIIWPNGSSKVQQIDNPDINKLHRVSQTN